MSKQNSKAISCERLRELESGAASNNLAEILAIDFAELLKNGLPQADSALLAAVQAVQGEGVLRRMQRTGELLAERLGEDGLAQLAAHGSDTLRGFACFLLAALADKDLPQRLVLVKPLADDAHFGVREWAWLALRPLMAAELERSIALLEPWTREPSAYLRRYASESLRPRGVWCSHIKVLKDNPALALPLLEPLKADASAYVQDSVANWLNDAGKSQAPWVLELCQRWQRESPGAQTARICKRALRNLADKSL